MGETYTYGYGSYTTTGTSTYSLGNFLLLELLGGPYGG